MLTYWVLYQFNVDDDYDTEIIGIYSTKRKAINKLLTIIRKEYNRVVSHDNDREWLEDADSCFEDWSSDEPPSWKEFKEMVKDKLSSSHGLRLDYLQYEFVRKTVDK